MFRGSEAPAGRGRLAALKTDVGFERRTGGVCESKCLWEGHGQAQFERQMALRGP